VQIAFLFLSPKKLAYDSDIFFLSSFESIVFSFLLGLIFPALFLLVENQVFGIPIDFFSATATIIILIAVSLAVFYFRKERKKKNQKGKKK